MTFFKDMAKVFELLEIMPESMLMSYIDRESICFIYGEIKVENNLTKTNTIGLHGGSLLEYNMIDWCIDNFGIRSSLFTMETSF